MVEVSIWIALIAGLVSFLSPCVLPLVPAYIGYMGGRVTHTVAVSGGQSGGAVVISRPSVVARVSTFLHGVAFVLGFTFIFVAIGLLGTAFVGVIGRQNITLATRVISRAGGLLIIFFGLHFMGVIPSLLRRLIARPQMLGSPLFSLAFAAVGSALILWAAGDALLALPFAAALILWIALGGGFTRPIEFWTKTFETLMRALYADTRRQMVRHGQGGFSSSALMGVIFAAGWTPCIGPIYGSILTLAVSGTDIARAGLLLAAYSFGLGIPFLLTALMLDGAQSSLRKIQRHIRRIELLSGAFLVIIGITVASGRLQDLSQNFATQFADLSYRMEECAISITRGEIGLGDYFNCVNAEPTAGARDVEAPILSSQSSATRSEAASTPNIGTNVGEIAPDFAATSINNQLISLSDLRGKTVVLNFWATWCGPCRIEMPALQSLYFNNRDHLVVLGINNGETREDIADFRDQYGLSFPLLLDRSAAIQQLYGIVAYPSTFVIDPEGIITAQYFGPLTEAQLGQLVTRVDA